MGVIVGPTSNLGQLADYIEAERGSGVEAPDIRQRARTRKAPSLHASDLTLDKFIDVKHVGRRQDARPRHRRAAHRLLTGANGYLGRFVALEWLQRLSQTGGRLIIIVRGQRRRQRRAPGSRRSSTAGTRICWHFRELAADHLEVIAGDIGEPNLGLDKATWTVAFLDHPVHPDISPANALLQAPRVAAARGLSEDQVRTLVNQSTEGRTLFVLGEPRVNVLKLNMALDNR